MGVRLIQMRGRRMANSFENDDDKSANLSRG